MGIKIRRRNGAWWIFVDHHGRRVARKIGSREAAGRFLGALKIFINAESLGGVETLISHPATMTHSSMGPEVRRELGITDGLIRLSVGIEDVEDLIAELDQGLALV